MSSLIPHPLSLIPLSCFLIPFYFAHADTYVTDGVNGIMSPDGTRIAFQRTSPTSNSQPQTSNPQPAATTRLGIFHLSDGHVEWVEDGSTCSGFPNWTGDGSLLYSYSYRAHTAYENWQKRRYTEGYTIRILKDGVTRDVFPPALGYDVSPSLAPDGSNLWFCSNRPLLPFGPNSPPRKYGSFIGNRLCHGYLDDSTSARQVYEGEAYSSTIGRCFSQPVVSPCGRVLAWAQTDSFTSGTWGIRLARPDSPETNTLVTPPKMIAYAPNWSPDGTNLVFTGCGLKDDGWYAYILNTRTQWMRRICKGENATFTADGRGLVYDLGEKLYRHELTADEEPTEADRILDDGEGRHPWMETVGLTDPETVLLSFAGENLSTNVMLASNMVFGDNTNVFLRIRMMWNGVTNRTQCLVRLTYDGNDRALQTYVQIDGKIHFSTREADRTQALVTTQTAIESNRVYTVTGIRSKGRLYLSLDGASPRSTGDWEYLDGFMPLVNPGNFVIRDTNYSPMQGTVIYSVELGVGWPSDVPSGLPSYVRGFDWEALP